MSTKIYQGVRLHVADLTDLHSRVTDWRKTVAGLQKAHDARFCAIIATGSIDDAAMKGEVKYGALWDAALKAEDRRAEVKRTQRRDPAVDTEFSLVILPIPERDMILGITYCEQRTWVEQFNSLPWVEEYAYWNNSDHPEHLTEDQWEMRSLMWEEALASDPQSRPGSCGFTVECVPSLGFPEVADAIEFVPTWEQRVKRVADNYSFKGWAEKTGLTNEAVRTSMFSTLREHDKWVKDTEEGRAHYAAVEADVMSKLQRVLTADDLNKHRPA